MGTGDLRSGRRLAAGELQLPYSSTGYEFPSRCLVCLEPPASWENWRGHFAIDFIGWRARLELALRIPYCATHTGAFEAHTLNPLGMKITVGGVAEMGKAMTVREAWFVFVFERPDYARLLAQANVARLMAGLSDDTTTGGTKSWYAAALAALGVVQARDAMIESIRALVLESPDHEPRRRLAVAVGELGPTAVEPLIGLLDDDIDVMREVGIVGAAVSGDPRFARPLIRVLRDDPAMDNRIRAGQALGAAFRHDPHVANALGAHRDKSLVVRVWLKKALKESADKNLRRCLVQ